MAQKKLFDSNDFASKSLNGSCIPAEGIRFKYLEYAERKTRFSEEKDGVTTKLMYVILGIAEQPFDGIGPGDAKVHVDVGDQLSILVNSIKLRDGLEKYKSEIIGKSVVLSGFDEGLKRHYTLELT